MYRINLNNLLYVLYVWEWEILGSIHLTRPQVGDLSVVYWSQSGTHTCPPMSVCKHNRFLLIMSYVSTCTLRPIYPNHLQETSDKLYLLISCVHRFITFVARVVKDYFSNTYTLIAFFCWTRLLKKRISRTKLPMLKMLYR